MSVSGNQHNVVEVRIPIMQRSTSVLDQDYGGSGGQFAEEMRKMEEEMGKLTGQISEGNKKIASRIVQKTTTTTTRTTSGGGPVPVQQPQQQAIQYSQVNQQQNQQQFNQQQQYSQPQAQPTGHSPSGGLVFSSPSGVQSHTSQTSTYSHQTSGTQGHQASPVPSGLTQQQQQQQQQHHTSTFTQQNSGSNLQPQFHSASPVPSQVGGIQEHSTHTTTSSHKTVTHHGSTTGGGAPQQVQPYGLTQQQDLDAANSQELQQWMGSLNSPLIHDHQDIAGQAGKCLRLRFDVSQYNADEISVKTVDGMLRIHAKHEEKTANRSAYREFNKEFSLPIGTDPSAIKSTLSKDGILTVEAPLPGQGQLGYGGHQQAINF